MARRRTGLERADADTKLLPLVPEAGTGPENGPDAGPGTGPGAGPDTGPGSAAGDGPRHRGPAAGHGIGEIELLDEGGSTLEPRPEDVLAEPPDARDISAELSAPPRRKLPWLTLLLSAGVVAAAAFSGGALVEKHHLQGSTTASRGNFPAFTGGTGAGARTTGGAATAGTGGRTFGGTGTGTGTGNGTGAAPGTGAVPGAGGTAASGVTVGTVKLVDGSTIYVTDAQGNIVKITTGGSTKVTEAKAGKVSDLQPGQSVTVRGTPNSAGDIAATTVTEGSTATAGGFGGFGGNRGGTRTGASGG